MKHIVLNYNNLHIECSHIGEFNIPDNSDLYIHFEPKNEYYINNVLVNGIEHLLTNNILCIQNVQTDLNIQVLSSIIKYPITLKYDEDFATIVPSSLLPEIFSNVEFIIQPKPNVELYCIILDGIPVEPYNKYKFNINKITSSHNVEFLFRPIRHLIFLNKINKGETSQVFPIEINQGDSIKLKFDPNFGYELDYISIEDFSEDIKFSVDVEVDGNGSVFPPKIEEDPDKLIVLKLIPSENNEIKSIRINNIEISTK